MSSRLLSAKNANGLAILPASSEDNKGEYICKGETKIVVIGDIIRASKSSITQLTENDKETLAVTGGCSGACGKLGETTDEVPRRFFPQRERCPHATG